MKVLIAKVRKTAKPYGGRWLRVVKPPYKAANGSEYVDLTPPPLHLHYQGRFSDVRQYPVDAIEQYREKEVGS